MTATPTTTPARATPSFNGLRRGATYRATTSTESTFGEYLGIESWHGDRAIILRHHAGIASIPLITITSIERAAAA